MLTLIQQSKARIAGYHPRLSNTHEFILRH